MVNQKLNTIKIFQIGYTFNKSGLYCINSDMKEFNEYRFYDDAMINDWPDGITFIFDGFPQDDFLLGGLHWMIISDRVKNTFEEEKVQNVQFLPVKVIHNKSGQDLGPHWVMNFYISVPKLDWNLVNNLDLFRFSTGKFISARLKKILIKEKIASGASFTPMADRVLKIVDSKK